MDATLSLTRVSAGANWVRQGPLGRTVAQIRAEKRLLVADGRPRYCSRRDSGDLFEPPLVLSARRILSTFAVRLWGADLSLGHTLISRLVCKGPYIRIFCGDLLGLAGRGGCERRAIPASRKRNCRRFSVA